MKSIDEKTPSNSPLMGSIGRMLEELCPEEVKYVKLGDCAFAYTGTQLNKSNMSEEGTYLVVNGGIEASGKTFDYNEEADVITISQGGASAGFVNIYYERIWLGAHCYAVTPGDRVNKKYLYYILKNNQFELMRRAQGAGIPGLNKKAVNSLEFPLPPLSIQEEIVRILDKFTAMQENLDKELTLRQKQYEYYREKLLTFEDGECEWKKLGEVCNVVAGGTPSKRNPEYWEGGNIKWLGSSVCQNVHSVTNITDYITEEGLKKSSTKLMHSRTLLIALVGATIGKVAYLTFDACINQNVSGITPLDRQYVSSEYLYYYSYKWYKAFYSLAKGKLGLATLSFVRSLQIPIPPLSRQREIVSILDKFEAMITNIKEEQKLRQKQYEYYREKLLTFSKHNQPCPSNIV